MENLSANTVPIFFYSTTAEYGFLSNFSRHGFELDGKYWPTVEHFFQAQKFAGTELEERIRRATSAKFAKELGRSQDVPLRADWEAVKDDIMHRAVLKKFDTHAELREKLLATGDRALVENAPGDYYWGCGADGSGQNILGKTLAAVRSKLQPKP